MRSVAKITAGFYISYFIYSALNVLTDTMSVISWFLCFLKSKMFQKTLSHQLNINIPIY